jgi:hypothetical protein
MKGSFWWKSILKLLNVYKGISQPRLDQEKLSCFGKTSGMVISCKTYIPSYIHSATMKMVMN